MKDRRTGGAAQESLARELLSQSKSDLTLVIIINWGRGGYIYIISASFGANRMLFAFS
jgi:hypothetical protein